MIRYFRASASASLALIIPAVVTGCASAPESATPPVRSAPQIQTAQIQAAQADYRACLLSAARYADDHAATVDSLATLIAPMCYPQFILMEHAATAAMSRSERRRFDAGGDQRQIDLASEALRAERASLALSAKP
jgi:hypothetical protein